MKRPTKFEIKGLFSNRTIELEINDDAIILVGPNGIGKSSVANIFYFFVTRQWNRLAEYDFSEVAIWFGGEEIRAARTDITGLSQLDRAFSQISPTTRIYKHIETLKTKDILDEFISPRKYSDKNIRYYADILSAPIDEIRHLQISLSRRISTLGEDDLLFARRTNFERKLAEMVPGRTLYLPTYRRIEKDLKEIFPDLEDRIRSPTRADRPFTFTRSSEHYVDLVSFGMEDVRTNIDSKSRFLRDYSLAQFNNLSGLYLRDVIKGTADQYSPTQIAKLDKENLAIILGRVSEQVLSVEEKDLLREKILGMKGKKRGQMEVNDLYLAHYFSRLMSASADISAQENEILSFVEVCNAYLEPGKHIAYNDTKFTIQIFDDQGREIDLSMLSSGEKQVVSLFSHLYLDESKGQIVIIDEPELSLSVPWQKRFLIDILNSSNCSFILAVTHSPFIYQNRLKSTAVDLRRRTVIAKQGQ